MGSGVHRGEHPHEGHRDPHGDHLEDRHHDHLEDPHGREVWPIREECWRLLEDLRSGDVDAEVGEQMVSVLDTLLDLARLEAQEEARNGERPACSQEGSEQAKSSEKRGG